MAVGDSPPPCYSSFAYSAYLRSSLWKAQAAQEVLKARVIAKGIQLGVGSDRGRALRAARLGIFAAIRKLTRGP